MRKVVARGRYGPGMAVWDYGRWAGAPGLKGIRVDDPWRIGPAWDDALAEGGPVLIEFMAGHDFPRPSVQRFVEQGA